MVDTKTLLVRLAEHLEAAADTVRELAGANPESVEQGIATDDADLARVSSSEWLEAAYNVHPQLGERQAQVLAEVIKAFPDGVGTGPIWRAIDYEQPNTYLALDALARQGLVRKDATVKPHKYYVGETLIRQMRTRNGKQS